MASYYELTKQNNPKTIPLSPGIEYPEDMIPYILDFAESDEAPEEIIDHLLKIGDVIADEFIDWLQSGSDHLDMLKDMGYTVETIVIEW